LLVDGVAGALDLGHLTAQRLEHRARTFCLPGKELCRSSRRSMHAWLPLLASVHMYRIASMQLSAGRRGKIEANSSVVVNTLRVEA
jgi:hypothetical protein